MQHISQVWKNAHLLWVQLYWQAFVDPFVLKTPSTQEIRKLNK